MMNTQAMAPNTANVALGDWLVAATIKVSSSMCSLAMWGPLMPMAHNTTVVGLVKALVVGNLTLRALGWGGWYSGS